MIRDEKQKPNRVYWIASEVRFGIAELKAVSCNALRFQYELLSTGNASEMMDLLRSRFEYVAAALFVTAWLFIVGLRALPIGGVWGPLDPRTNWFIVLWVSFAAIAMIAGGWIARKKFKSISQSRMDPNLPVMLLSLASLIGAMLIIIEFAFVRGYGFTMPVAEIRQLELNRGIAGAAASLLSGPGRLMMPAILPAFLIAALEWRRLSKTAWLIFGFAAAIFLYEQIKFEGGRWFFFGTYFAIAFLLIGDALRKGQQDEIHIRRKSLNAFVFLSLCGVILFGYSASVFVNRSDHSGEGQVAAYERFVTVFIEERGAKTVSIPKNTENASQPNETAPQPNDDETSKPGEEFSRSAVGKLLFHPITKFFWIYATHGVNELNNLMLRDSFAHSLGAFQFSQLARISDKLLGTELRVEYKENFPNEGLYTTMIGASYVDFGFAGAIAFGVVFGVMLGFWANLFGRQSGFTFSSMAFPVMMTVAILSPIISIVNHMWPVMCWAVVAYFIAKFVCRDNSATETRPHALQ